MKKNKNILRNEGFQTLLASVICIIFGVLIGFIALLIINPAGASDAIVTILKNFMYFPGGPARMMYFGSTLVKTAPLLMCSLSILFAFKVGLFNIGAAGQYVIGAMVSLTCALQWHLPWFVCLIAAAVMAAVWGGISGALKAYYNVNEVISGIMLNWISLYVANIILKKYKEPSSPYTVEISSKSQGSLIPSCGLEHFFTENEYVTIAIPLAILMAVFVWVLLEKTKFGFELKATGLNKNAAKYCGMKEKANIIYTMMISGALAGMGAAFLYLTGIEQWATTQTSVPNMGFNGIAAAFLGGLHPIGAVFASYLIQHITSGGAYVDKTMYCSQISDFISAIIIYLCGFVFFFKLWMNKKIRQRDEKKAEQVEKGGAK